MVFKVWLAEFCRDHKRYQVLYKSLELNCLSDLFGTIITFIIPKRVRVIESFQIYEIVYLGYEFYETRSWYENDKLEYEACK